MNYLADLLNRVRTQYDVPNRTGLPAGTFMGAKDMGGLMDLINARDQAGILPGQTTQAPGASAGLPAGQQGAVPGGAAPLPAMQMPAAMGPMSMLAYQMGAAPRSMTQWPPPGMGGGVLGGQMQIPRSPKTPYDWGGPQGLLPGGSH